MKTARIFLQRACCSLLLFASTAAFGQTWTWNHKAAMPTPRSGVRAAVVGGKLFAVGGYVFGEPRGPRGNRELDTPVTTVEVYDPQKNNWSTVAPLPVAGRLGVAVIGDTLYAVVGTAQAIYAYEPDRNRWTAKRALPVKLDNFATVAVNGRIYTVGGVPGDTSEDTMRNGVVFEYNPASDTWTRRADMPTHRHALSTTVFKGKIYALGGVPGRMGNTAAFEEYDPAADRWTAKEPMTHAVAYGSALVSKDRVYMFGSTRVGGTNSTKRVQVYDPASSTWKVIEDVFPSLMGSTVVELDGHAYSIGGWRSGEGVLSEMLECDLG